MPNSEDPDQTVLSVQSVLILRVLWYTTVKHNGKYSEREIF